MQHNYTFEIFKQTCNFESTENINNVPVHHQVILLIFICNENRVLHGLTKNSTWYRKLYLNSIRTTQPRPEDVLEEI